MSSLRDASGLQWWNGWPRRCSVACACVVLGEENGGYQLNGEMNCAASLGGFRRAWRHDGDDGGGGNKEANGESSASGGIEWCWRYASDGNRLSHHNPTLEGPAGN